MYEPGSLYYFKPYYFAGGDSKYKYFLCLFKDYKSVIVAALPSSVDYVPSHIPKNHGCLNDLSTDFNAYHFKKGVTVTMNGWCFPKDTFIYSQWTNLFNLEDMQATYQVEGVDYDFIGILNSSELKAIIKCFLAARTLKNKVKKLLQLT